MKTLKNNTHAILRFLESGKEKALSKSEPSWVRHYEHNPTTLIYVIGGRYENGGSEE